MSIAARTARRRGVVRDELLETAWRLAREGGVAAVSLKNVADRMGVKDVERHGDSTGRLTGLSA